MKEKGCEIEALDINYTVEANPILKDVSLTAKPSEILAIVGPSGAGKSSLLEILAGKLTPQSASIFVNHKPIHKARFKRISGYVAQRDTLFPLLTVEETLRFGAQLRLRLPRADLASRVGSLLRELGLAHVAAARVGDDRVRGISGGERRRVSIGLEVIHQPEVLILDEPTSGLDSTSAHQIIDMLHVMAEANARTIILSIHQPAFRIVKLFGTILLLAGGVVLHHGSVDLLSVNLMLMDLPLPVHVNVVEFAIESIDAIAAAAPPPPPPTKILVEEGSSRTGKFTLQQLFQQSKVIDEESIDVGIGIGVGIELHRGFTNSRMHETLILSHRFCKNIYRSKELFVCRSISMLASGVVLGSIFYQLSSDLIGAEERVGLFAFILTFLLSSTVEALPVFLQEKEILMKETSSGSYRVSSYAVANGVVYLPYCLILALLFTTPVYWLVGLNRSAAAFAHFLTLIWLILYTANSVVVCFSALVPNFIVGNSVISAVMGSFFLFSGYFISKNGLPSYWVFMHYISLFKYPFEGLLINEFSRSGECLETMLGACVVRGEDVLREEGYGDEGSRWRNYVIMLCFILVYRFVAYLILRYKCYSHGG
ncbi:ABC transporter G family member 5 [Salvia miltiorrhiza]|uniref:ABC transporter G family member 5 n=1 Tax=Salvia miltiorrhiza TaxID=226208 RepID=UPI0025AC50BC|nr:ABC transporter G family member 5 [Salvia miltiorrhiza]